jgi:regulator of sirC expression with transglutaminase-like and TPR domain
LPSRGSSKAAVLMGGDLLDDFSRVVNASDERVDLGRAALEIARDDYPDLDVSGYLRRIDQLAAHVGERLGNEKTVYHSIAALNSVIFQERGFRGNRDNYYDPKNSFLNEVIERRMGIPISLSVLYMEVAQRIGLPLQGVSFPGHFLVKYCDDREKIVIDPFNAGEIKSKESLGKLLENLYGGNVTLVDDFLEAVTKKQIIRRMLNNLKMIYLREKSLLKGLAVLQRLVILDPASAEDIRDRGAVYLKLECFQYALADFESYLRLVPNAKDADAVKEEIVGLSKQVQRIH